MNLQETLTENCRSSDRASTYLKIMAILVAVTHSQALADALQDRELVDGTPRQTLTVADLSKAIHDKT